MKKVSVILMAALLLFSATGCSYRLVDGHEVETITSTDDALCVAFSVDPEEQAFSTENTKFKSWFITDPEDLANQIIDMCKDKYDLKIIYQSNNFIWLGFNDDEKYIEINLEGENVEYVDLSLSAKTTDEAKRNGDFIYYLIDSFSPGLQELVSDELQIFDDDDDKYPENRRVIAGYTVYDYDTLISTLTISAAYDEDSTTNAIRPD